MSFGLARLCSRPLRRQVYSRCFRRRRSRQGRLLPRPRCHPPRPPRVHPHASLLHQGLARLKATGADVVLIDPQYAPRVLAKPNIEGMVSLIATAAKAEHVSLFHRFDLMRHWYQTEHLPFETFVSPDGLHM